MRPFVLPLLLLLAVVVPSARATPVDDVLHLVPANTVVCFVVRDLRGHSTRIAESPFADWFRQSDLGKAVLASEGVTKLHAAEKAITTQLDMTVEEIRDDVFGDAMAFAYQPAHRAEKDSGVFLLKARKPDTLAKLIEKVNLGQQQSGEVKAVTERKHRDRVYYERDKGAEKEFYRTCADGVFAFTGQESAIRAVIETEVAAKPTTPSKFAAQLDRLGARSAAGVLLFDPRQLDAELAAKTKETKDPNEKAFLTQFSKVWAATNGVGLALTLDRSAELAVHLAFDADRLPAEWKPLLTPDAGSTALWSVIPNDAVFAVAGRFDLLKTADGVKAMMSDEAIAGAKKTTAETVAPILGRDTLPKLIAGVGPDWGLWLVRPDKASGSALPTATIALRVRKAGSTDPSVGDTLMSGLDTVAHLFRVAYNKGHDDQFTFADEKSDSSAVKVLKNPTALPAGVSPSYGLRGDFLVLASHPNGVTGFTPPKDDAKVDSAPLVRVSAKALTGYLKEKGADLGQLIGGWTGENPETVSKGLRELVTVLEVGDRLELRHTTDGNRVKLSLQIETVRPLKK